MIDNYKNKIEYDQIGIDPKWKIELGFAFLILFCVFRPILLVDVNVGLAGLNLLELFAISISYLLLLIVILNIKKVELDFVTISIFLFCFYCLFSVTWGSHLKKISQVLLPFVVYFSTRLFVKKRKQADLLISIVIISYLIPLFGSVFQIAQGESVSLVESMTGIERQSGLYKGVRQLANAMYFFSVFFYLKFFLFRPKNKYVSCFLLLIFSVSIYCAYESYTRSILLALFIFWSITIYGINKKYLLLFVAMLLMIGILNHSKLQMIFFKKSEFEINTASSGRAFLWKHNIDLFKNYRIYEKFLGRGLGTGSKKVIGEESEIWSSHNDYLHLLMQLGFTGLLLYSFINLAVLRDLFIKNTNRKIKFFYLGFFSSIVFINFSSGIITYQVPTAQMFWMVIAFNDRISLNKTN